MALFEVCTVFIDQKETYSDCQCGPNQFIWISGAVVTVLLSVFCRRRWIPVQWSPLCSALWPITPTCPQAAKNMRRKRIMRRGHVHLKNLSRYNTECHWFLPSLQQLVPEEQLYVLWSLCKRTWNQEAWDLSHAYLRLYVVFNINVCKASTSCKKICK